MSDSLWPHEMHTTSFSILHYLPEFVHTHVHWVSDAILPFHPLSPPSPFAFNLSQLQGLFQLVESLHQVAIVLDFSLTGLISLQQKWLLRVFSSATIQKHQLFGTQPFLWSKFHIPPYMTTGKNIALTIWIFVSKMMSLIFNELSRFVIAFLLWSKPLLISWLQSVSSDFGAQENKVCHCF